MNLVGTEDEKVGTRNGRMVSYGVPEQLLIIVAEKWREPGTRISRPVADMENIENGIAYIQGTEQSQQMGSVIHEEQYKHKKYETQ